jgi:transposase-like protein
MEVLMSQFSKKDRELLLANPYVRSVTESQVLFSPEFKLKAIELHAEGLRPSDIFQKLGIGPNLFRGEYPKKTIHRWEMIYREHGEDGLVNERRGKQATGRPKKSSKSPVGEAALLARIAYLEEEIDFLKKVRALEEKYANGKGSR